MRCIKNISLPKPYGNKALKLERWYFLLDKENFVQSIDLMPVDGNIEGEDWAGYWVSPMGVDLQINGGLGLNFNSLEMGNLSKLLDLLDTLWVDGIEAICPTLISCSGTSLRTALEVLHHARKQCSKNRCKLLGAHLEGPFLSSQFAGAHDLNFLCTPNLDGLNERIRNYEGEIALVVGKTAKNIELKHANEYIWGYTIANDFGLHDFRDTDENSMVRVKGSDTLGVVGPELVIGWDYRNKIIRTLVDDKIVQESNTADMMWSPEYLLADLSRSITFEKGDLILTGTPSNSRPVEPGSIVKVEVEGLGTLENKIQAGKLTLLKDCGAIPKNSEHIRSISYGSDNKSL